MLATLKTIWNTLQTKCYLHADTADGNDSVTFDYSIHIGNCQNVDRADVLHVLSTFSSNVPISNQIRLHVTFVSVFIHSWMSRSI